MNPVRVGVIGIGNMGWHHARVLSLLKDAQLVGVADPAEARGKLAMEQFGCRWFPDYTTMLSEVEAVCIAVPTLLHHRVDDSLRALQHNRPQSEGLCKNLLCAIFTSAWSPK